MPVCPFAVWKPITGPVGNYNGGPFKIVHHTTEGTSAAGAFAAFQKNRSDPHFTVDAATIYQHIDTDKAARALRNAVGGVETNRNRAIQIEVVGVAAVPKSRATLENVARLCRWLEGQHGIPRVWPSGPPKPAANGRDPGGHNRNAATWTTEGGHYGHSQVPENIHWDPGYTADEARFLLEADPAAEVELDDDTFQQRYPTIPLEEPVLTGADVSMHDHSVTDVEEPEHAATPARRREAQAGMPLLQLLLAAGVLATGAYLLRTLIRIERVLARLERRR